MKQFIARLICKVIGHRCNTLEIYNCIEKVCVRCGDSQSLEFASAVTPSTPFVDSVRNFPPPDHYAAPIIADTFDGRSPTQPKPDIERDADSDVHTRTQPIIPRLFKQWRTVRKRTGDNS